VSSNCPGVCAWLLDLSFVQILKATVQYSIVCIYIHAPLNYVGHGGFSYFNILIFKKVLDASSMMCYFLVILAFHLASNIRLNGVSNGI